MKNNQVIFENARHEGYIGMRSLDIYQVNKLGTSIIVVEDSNDFADYMNSLGIGYRDLSSNNRYHIVIGNNDTNYDKNYAFAMVFARYISSNGIKVSNITGIVTNDNYEVPVISISIAG